MRITLIKYISEEIWSIFMTCMIVIIFIFLASEMLKLIEYMVSMGVGLKDLFRFIMCLIPKAILLAMPIACLMAVLLSFIRMGSDNEITALHSSGISLYQLMPPVVLFCFICLIFSLFLTMFWAPYGSRTEKSLKMDILKSKADFMIKERVFTDLTKDVVFYVSSYSPKERVMEDLFIVDKRDGLERTFVAKKGRFLSDKNGDIIQLFDVSIFPDDKDGKSQVHSFHKVFNYKFERDDRVEGQAVHDLEPEEMYPGELISLIAKGEDSKNKALVGITFYEMFSMPLAVFLIGLAGAPLGAQIRAQGRTKGIVISLLLFLSYDIILLSVRTMCENGAILPAFGVWLPVLFLFVISTVLLVMPSGRIFYCVTNRLISAVKSIKNTGDGHGRA